jgi:hypothetical protein
MESTAHFDADTRPANGQSNEIMPGVLLGGGSGDAPAKADTAVDLAAWGRGEREYPFDEVRLAIDERIIREIERIVDSRFVSLQSRRDAVEWLIKEGLIEAAEARTDV